MMNAGESGLIRMDGVDCMDGSTVAGHPPQGGAAEMVPHRSDYRNSGSRTSPARHNAPARNRELFWEAEEQIPVFNEGTMFNKQQGKVHYKAEAAVSDPRLAKGLANSPLTAGATTNPWQKKEFVKLEPMD